MTHLGKRIKTLRVKCDLTQAELADQLHVTRQAISSWECDRTEPDINTLERLCDVFGIGMNDFLLEYEAKVKMNKEHYWYLSVVSTLLISGMVILSINFEINFLTHLLAVIILICMFSAVLSINGGLNKDDYTSIAGYDQKVLVDVNVYRDILKRIRDHILWASILTIIFMYAIALIATEPWWTINVLIAYVMDIVIAVHLINSRCADTLYVHENDKFKAQASSMLVSISTVMLCFYMIIYFLKTDTTSNTLGVGGFILFAVIILLTVCLVTEHGSLKKIESLNKPYQLSKRSLILYGITSMLIIIGLLI